MISFKYIFDIWAPYSGFKKIMINTDVNYSRIIVINLAVPMRIIKKINCTKFLVKTCKIKIILKIYKTLLLKRA